MIKVAFKIRDKDGNTYKKSKLGTYTLHNIQAFIGFPFFNRMNLMWPIFLIVSPPQNTLLILGVMKSLEFLK